MAGQSIIGAIKKGINKIGNIFTGGGKTPFSQPTPSNTISPQSTQSASSVANAGLTGAVAQTGQTNIGKGGGGGGGGGGSGGGSGGGGVLANIPEKPVESVVDPEGYQKKQEYNLQQQRLESELKTAGKIDNGSNITRRYDEVVGVDNRRYIRVEENKGGISTRRIFIIDPRRKEYRLINQQQANVTGLETSQLQQASVKDIIKFGDKEIVFESVQPLYTTKEGKLATAYGTFDITEDAVIQEEQEARSKAAEQFINEKGFAPVISEPTEKKSVLGKVFNELKVFYRATAFGSNSPIEVEGDEKRTIGTPKLKTIFGTPLFPIPLRYLELDIGTARELSEGTDRDPNVANQQIKAVEDLGLIIESAPEELKYDVQQAGISKLKDIGINYVVDESTGELIFTSKEITPRKSFTGLGQQRSIEQEKSPLPYQLISGGLYGTEFLLGGEAIGLAFRPLTLGYNAVRGGIGLERGLQLTEVTIQGGKVIGTAEFVEQSALRKVLGKVGSVAKTGTIIGVGAGIYGLERVSKYGYDIDVYGKEAGKQIFVTETIGQLAGIGGSIAGGFAKNLEIKQVNQGIAARNLERDLQLQRLENVKGFGQFSKQARVTFAEIGTGRSVLTKGERELLKGVFVRETGVSPAQAEKLIQEGAIFEQNLIVDSPAGFEPFVFSRSGILRSRKVGTGFEELALEFTRRGRRVTNLGIKATTGEGEYSLTSIFERTRKSKKLRELLEFGELKFIKETAPQDQLKLKEVIVSKVGKQKRLEIDGVTFSAAEIESRLLKSFPKTKDRTTVLETLEQGFPRYSEKQLADLFEGAGVSARTSPKPQQVVRVEEALFRKEGILKVQRGGEYEFLQTGISGRQLSLKNIFKDLDFTDLEQALKTRRARKTPFSKTFGTEATQDQKFVKEIEKQFGEGRGRIGGSEQRAIQEQRTAQINIAPTISSGFKLKGKVKNVEELKVAEDILSKSGVSIKESIRELLGVRSESKTKQRQVAQERVISAVRERTLQREIQIQQQRQRQNQSARLRSPQVTLPRVALLPSLEPPSTRIRVPPERIAFNFGRDQKRKQRILNLKKILKEDELAFFPTFTAKALDIPAIEVGSEKEALRLIKQIRTGFEVTGGIKIRK